MMDPRDEQQCLSYLMDVDKLTGKGVWENSSKTLYTSTESWNLSLGGLKVRRRWFLERIRKNFDVWGEPLQPETEYEECIDQTISSSEPESCSWSQ